MSTKTVPLSIFDTADILTFIMIRTKIEHQTIANLVNNPLTTWFIFLNFSFENVPTNMNQGISILCVILSEPSIKARYHFVVCIVNSSSIKFFTFKFSLIYSSIIKLQYSKFYLILNFFTFCLILIFLFWWLNGFFKNHFLIWILIILFIHCTLLLNFFLFYIFRSLNQMNGNILKWSLKFRNILKQG